MAVPLHGWSTVPGYFVIFWTLFHHWPSAQLAPKAGLGRLPKNPAKLSSCPSVPSPVQCLPPTQSVAHSTLPGICNLYRQDTLLSASKTPFIPTSLPKSTSIADLDDTLHTLPTGSSLTIRYLCHRQNLSSPSVHNYENTMSRRPPNPAAERAAKNQATIKSLLKLEPNKMCSDCKRNKRTSPDTMEEDNTRCPPLADTTCAQIRDGQAGI